LTENANTYKHRKAEIILSHKKCLNNVGEIDT